MRRSTHLFVRKKDTTFHFSRTLTLLHTILATDKVKSPQHPNPYR